MIEVIVDGPHPVVARAALEAAVGQAGSQVVLTDRAGTQPAGVVPEGGILVTTLPLVEAVKLTEGGRVLRSVERSQLVEVVVPAALSRDTLVAVLEACPDEEIDLPAWVARIGGPVEGVALPA